jgi:hypothetical protein
LDTIVSPTFSMLGTAAKAIGEVAVLTLADQAYDRAK